MSSIRRALMSGLALLAPAAAAAPPLGRRALPRWAISTSHPGSLAPSPLPAPLSGRLPARGGSTAAAATTRAAEPADSTPLDAASTQDNHQRTQHNGTATTTAPTPVPLILEDDAHPLRYGGVSRPCWAVLSRLRAAGHEAFLVGGTVRDILMGARPKDFDVLTSADPDQAAALFARAYVLGRSFPIVHVHHDGEIIEVSSFSTGTDPSRLPPDAAAHARGSDHRREARRVARRAERDRGKKKWRLGDPGAGGSSGGADAAAVATLADSLLAAGTSDGATASLNGDGSSSSGGEGWGVAPPPAGPTWAAARRDNAWKRDFTVNGLLYDPFGRILYDYVGGVADCRARLLRTLGPPADSFFQDPARILRGVRLAARAGLDIDSPTAAAMARLAPLTAALPHGRLQMELAAVMAAGAAAPSVRLLWRFGLLDTMVPLLAALLAAERVPREPTAAAAAAGAAPGAALMYEVLEAMDAQAGVGRPLDSAVWVTALAAPLVAAECRRAAKRRRYRRRRAVADADGVADADADADGNASGAEGEAEQGEPSGRADADQPEHEGNDRTSGAVTPEYLEAYSKAVDRVLGRLLAPPDAKTRRVLAGAPQPPLALESGGNDAAVGGSDGSGARGGDEGADPNTTHPSVACLLPRQAVESARELFLLEAELRGKALPAPEEGVPKKATRRSAGHTVRRLRRGRLNATEHLALQLLRAPGVDWAAATAL